MPHVAAGPRVLVVGGEVRDPVLIDAGYRLTHVENLAEVGTHLRSRSFSLIHAHEARTGSAVCLNAILTPSPPMLVSLHDRLSERAYRGLSGQAERWLTGRALARAVAVIVPGEEDRAALLRLFPNLRLRQERIIAIPEGVEVSADQRLEVPATAGRSVAYASGSVPCDALLTEALARLSRHGGVPAFRAGEGEPVHCDLFVAPSRDAARGAMAALCAGVPVLGCAALREILHGTPARIYGPSVAELEVALREAISSPWTDEASKYAPIARERFDIRHSSRRLIELYDRLTTLAEFRAA